MSQAGTNVDSENIIVDNQIVGQTISETAPFITSYRLNRSYDFVRVYDGRNEPAGAIPHSAEIFVVCNSLLDLFSSFRFFKKKELHDICDFVGIKYTTKSSCNDMLLSLLTVKFFWKLPI